MVANAIEASTTRQLVSVGNWWALGVMPSGFDPRRHKLSPVLLQAYRALLKLLPRTGLLILVRVGKGLLLNQISHRLYDAR